MLIESRV